MARQDLTKLVAATAGDTTPTDNTSTVTENAQPTRETERKPAAPKKASPKADREAKPTPPVADVTGGEDRENAVKGVPVHLPDDINDRLKQFMATTGRSHQIVLMDAIETEYERLGERIKEKLGLEVEKPRTSLFERDTRTAPKTSANENRNKHTVRMTGTNRRILDKLTEDLGAPSRNFLIITAYEAYLPDND